MKTAVVTGVTGQDGAYLAELLLDKGYRVYGTYPPHQLGQLLASRGTRRRSTTRTCKLVEFDLTDLGACVRLLQTAQPR